jgi:hypothetical protein
MSDQQDSEIGVRMSTRISVSLDDELRQFVRRAAGERHQTLSATVRGLLAEMARTRNSQTSSEAA